MSFEDDDLEGLLTNGHLSGRAYDRIEARVMDRVLPRARPSRLYWVMAAALPAAAALSGIVFYLSRPAEEANPSGGFTAKGVEGPLAGAVELRCSADRGCRTGDTLMFLVDTNRVQGYLSASAQRITPPSPERIRFFPTDSGESPLVEATGGMKVVEKGVRLGPSLGPGVYRVDVRWAEGAPSADPGAGSGTSVELKIDQ